MSRIVCQFSCGAASAVATKLALAQYGGTRDVQIVNAFIKQEHEDNRRFLADCETWFTKSIVQLREQKFGGDIIKVFPAGAGGASYFKDIAGPLPFIPLMPTGGVSLDNIKDFADAGAAAFGLGSALVDTKQAVTDEYLTQLTEKARQFVAAVAG